jgi:hypothetical protein
VKANPEYFELGREAARRARENLTSITTDSEDELYHRLALLFFLVKAVKTYHAIEVLCREGFEEDALVLTRTLVEICFQVQYIAEEPSRARLFIDHDAVRRYEYYLDYKEASKRADLPDLEVDEKSEEHRELVAQYESLRSRYRRRGTWWGDTIWKLAEHLGSAAIARYVMLYWEQSGLTHSAITSARRYMDEDSLDGSIVILYDPQEMQSRFVPEQATLLLLQIVNHAVDAYGLDLKIIPELTDRFSALRGQMDVDTQD